MAFCYVILNYVGLKNCRGLNLGKFSFKLFVTNYGWYYTYKKYFQNYKLRELLQFCFEERVLYMIYFSSYYL